MCACRVPAAWICARHSASAGPDRKVVVLSVYDDEQYLFQALRVGASGYLLKSISSDELVRQLEFVHRGVTAIDPGMAARAADTAARMQRDEFWPGARRASRNGRARFSPTS